MGEKMKCKKNKKGNTLLVVGVIILFLIGFISATIIMVNMGTSSCKKECELYNAEFIKYKDGGFASSECWCKKDGMPLRVG